MRSERPSLMLNLIDEQALTVRVKQVLKAQYGDSAGENVQVSDLLVCRNKKALEDWFDRDLVLIDHEGMYYWANDFGLISVPVFQGMQMTFVKVGSNVLAEMITDEQADLAEHVHTFGDRLESNFDGAYHMATVGREV